MVILYDSRAGHFMFTIPGIYIIWEKSMAEIASFCIINYVCPNWKASLFRISLDMGIKEIDYSKGIIV